MDAVTRIQQIGMPRRNNELWTFFPVAKIPAQEYAGASTATEAAASLPDFEKLIANETDFAALLPLAKNARTMVRTIPEGANEMAMLKCNDDFGHTVLDIGKGAHVSLEILDNKVQHEIVAERFDISVGEGADVEIFFANPASALPLRFRHFRITQAANSTVRFSNILTDSGIGRISMDCDLNGEGASFDYRSLSILDNTASMHQRLTIRHNAPNMVSTQLARNLLSGSAYASYDGMVIVGENAPR